MRNLLLCVMAIAGAFICRSQTLEKMQWFNEPEQWEIKDNKLIMKVTP